MTNRGRDEYNDYSPEKDRGPFPNLLDIAAELAYGLHTIYRVVSWPVRKGLGFIASRTIEGICHAEGIEDSDL